MSEAGGRGISVPVALDPFKRFGLSELDHMTSHDPLSVSLLSLFLFSSSSSLLNPVVSAPKVATVNRRDGSKIVLFRHSAHILHRLSCRRVLQCGNHASCATLKEFAFFAFPLAQMEQGLILAEASAEKPVAQI